MAIQVGVRLCSPVALHLSARSSILWGQQRLLTVSNTVFFCLIQFLRASVPVRIPVSNLGPAVR